MAPTYGRSMQLVKEPLKGPDDWALLATGQQLGATDIVYGSHGAGRVQVIDRTEGRRETVYEGRGFTREIASTIADYRERTRIRWDEDPLNEHWGNDWAGIYLDERRGFILREDEQRELWSGLVEKVGGPEQFRL